MDDPKEKRREPRVPLILQVEYPGHGRVLRDTTENLSASGLFIRTEREVPIGERLPLQVSFPGLLPPLVVEVEVVRCRPAGPMGPRGLAVRVPQDRLEDRRALAALGADARGVAGRTGGTRPAYRILVVEDNLYVVEMYKYALRKLGGIDQLIGVELHFASNGHEALAFLAEQRPDLVVLDLYMPVMDGFKLLERVRCDPALVGLPVLVISACEPDARKRAVDLGVDIFLLKPVQLTDLVGTVRLLLSRQA